MVYWTDWLGYLAGRSGNLHWLWLSSLMIALQWFTDAFDAIGRHKNTGLVKWGFLYGSSADYVFLKSDYDRLCIIGTIADQPQLIYLLIPVFAAFMIASF